MTDIFTHAVILNSLDGFWKPKLKVLDVGTGHGYLAFLTAQILENITISLGNNFRFQRMMAKVY